MAAEEPTHQPERVIAGNCPDCGRVVVVFNNRETWPLQVRWSDDEVPTVWMATAKYQRGDEVRWEATGAMGPTQAVLRLCEILIDGGHCTHCSRPTGFTEHFDGMPLDQLVCWYQWDPELSTFRRGCE